MTRPPSCWRSSAALLLLALAGCAPAPPPAGATYVLDGVRHEIDAAECQAWLRHKRVEGRDEGEEAIRQLALTRALAERGKSAGLEADPDLAFRARLRERDRLERELRRQVASEIAVPEQVIRDRYEQRRARFHRPRSVRLMHVFRRVAEGAPAEIREEERRRLDEVRRHALAGADFATLAREHSDSQTRFRGGVIGYVVPGQLPPDVERVVLGMEPGEISDVLAVPDGLAIFRCDAVRPPEAVPFEEARAELERALRAAEQDRRWKELARGWLSSAAMSVDWAAAQGEGVAREAPVLASGPASLTRGELEILLRASGAGDGLPRPRLEKLLEQHVLQASAAEEARRRGLDADPDVAAAISFDRMALLATEQMRRMVEERLAVPTEEEVRAYWEARRPSFRHRPSYDVSVIELPVDESRLRESHEKAHALADRLASGEVAFEEAARTRSIHPTAAAGGRMGWLPARRLASMPNVLATLQELAPGEISRVVAQDGRLFILKLEGADPEREMTYEEARPRAEQRLGSERVGELQQQLEEEQLAALQVAAIAP